MSEVPLKALRYKAQSFIDTDMSTPPKEARTQANIKETGCEPRGPPTGI